MRFLRSWMSLTAVAVLSLGVLAAGCGGSDTPMSPQRMEQPGQLTPTAELTLSNATISVGGQTVNGQTVQHGQMQGENTFFQAMLHEGDHLALGQTVQVKYQWPSSGMGMMNRQGLVTMYDDGTHGDWQAGDGIYCFDDQNGEAGFHMHDAPLGMYSYEFYGVHDQGHHSNHVDVSVTVAAEPASQPGELMLSNALISVGGQQVNGLTIQHDQMQGVNTFFQVKLHEGDHPALGQTVQVKYQWPGGMGMMMGQQGIVTLYDDGTHGDWQAGDGIYCLDDFQHQAGFCGQGAPSGTYHYEFWGEGAGGHHSNHIELAVTVTNQ